jgi:ketosteroid isomerase-like protein
MRSAVFFLIAILTACTAPIKAPPPDDAKAIREAESAKMKAATARDLDALVAFYTDDASVLTPNAPIFTGKQPIKDGLKPMLSDPQFSLILIPTRVEVSKSGDLAYTQGPYKMTFSDIRGNKFEDEGKYLTVWRKLADGSWKAVEDTMNSDLPLPPPPE